MGTKGLGFDMLNDCWSQRAQGTSLEYDNVLLPYNGCIYAFLGARNIIST